MGLPPPTFTRCRSCQEHFRPTRAGHLTCSDRCRQRRARLKRTAARSVFLAREWGIEPRDQWRTHPDDFAPLAAEFRFTLDAAALAHDALCPRFITPEQDALAVSWLELAGDDNPCAWCNPPYSRKGGGLRAWVEKALEEAAAGLPSVLLVPPSPGSRYMQLAHRWGHEVRWWPTRRDFVHPDTGAPVPGNRGDSCVLVFTPERLLKRPNDRARYSYIGQAGPPLPARVLAVLDNHRHNQRPGPRV